MVDPTLTPSLQAPRHIRPLYPKLLYPSVYCTKTINSLGGVTVTMPNEILVSLTGPGTCDTPPKKFVNVTKCTWKKKITKNRRKFDYFWISFGHWRTRDLCDISLILGKLWRVTNELIVLVQ